MKKTIFSKGLRIIAVLSLTTSLVFFGLGNSKIVYAHSGGSAVCGNGVKEGGEQCDDGNTANGDGCSSSCTIEPSDVCSNIDGVQTSYPSNTVNSAGACVCKTFYTWKDGTPSESGCEKCQVVPESVGLCHFSPGHGWNSQNPSVDSADVAGHNSHGWDIIPVFTVKDECGNTVVTYPGKNLGMSFGGVTGAQILANGCKIPVCGDGVKDNNEQCDDGVNDRCDLQGASHAGNHDDVVSWDVDRIFHDPDHFDRCFFFDFGDLGYRYSFFIEEKEED